MGYKQLIINPGSTSTKLALYEDKEKVVQENVEHDAAQMQQFDSIADQIPFRMGIIRDFMARNSIQEKDLSAVMGRGGLVFGLKTGGYEVNDDLCEALVNDRLSQPHASNLGGLLARELARPLGIPAYIYDAVTGGELTEVAKITGIRDIERRSFCHVLNSRAMAIRYAQENDLDYNKLNLIVAHLGGGISASVHAQGRIIDSIGDDDGQFSPERSGSVPSLELIRLCFSGDYTKADMVKDGDQHADLVFQAQAYQIAKGIGLLSIVLKGKCDAIILTGGVARSQMLTDRIKEYVSFIAPVAVLPGENEMEALALGGLRLLSGEETARQYAIPQN